MRSLSSGLLITSRSPQNDVLNGRFLRHYSLTLLLLLAATFLLLLLIEHQLKEGLVIRLKLESNILFNQLNKQLDTSFSEIKSDLRFLSEQESLHHLHELKDRESIETIIKQLWVSFAGQRTRYDQIRLLDAEGMETIRVNFNNGKPVVVEKDALQSKSKRYYFSEAITLPSGEIYVSPMDLNFERGAVELPLKPMIRFATPVVNESGQNVGVLVLNYLAEKTLEEFRRSSTGFFGNALLINSSGYPLSSPESASNWNFMFPDSPQTGTHTRHPEIWQLIKKGQRGQLMTQEGLFTFDIFNPSGRPLSKNCTSCLVILLHVPDTLIEKKLALELKETLPPLLMALLLIGLILGALLWHRDKRRAQEREISKLHGEIAHERDLFVNGPGIIVKIRNEIGWPVDYISANIQGFLNYRPQQFLNGSLCFSSIIEPTYLSQYISESEQANLQHKDIFKRSPYRLLDAQGIGRWVQDISQPIRDSQGKITHYYSHISDITALKDTEQKLKLSRDHIQRVVDTIPDPTLVIDIGNYQLLLANQAARDLYNGNRSIGKGMTCYRLSHKRDLPCTGLNDPCPIQEVMLTGKSASVRHKHFNDKGKMLFVDVRATPLFDETGTKVVQVVESHRDVTEAVELEKQLQHMANTDRLTQVFNRMKFDEELKNQIEWAHSTQNPLGLIMFDLDHFKAVNDNHGHDVGDEVLKRIVELVMCHIRKSDTLARWGGEEFMIITPLTDVFELKTIAESLREKIEELEHATVGQVTASFGGSVLKPRDTLSTLVKRVDTALYQSKQSGRNRCTVIE
ncbi:MAG: diguanylate cyclase [Candidatus Thiodiazotropha sp. (ex Monitilora ramsayi)]|nr:diguanylate cyclase [Candidatus Thiodiazotropha sp. (ex Monitilora ramsayi)]